MINNQISIHSCVYKKEEAHLPTVYIQELSQYEVEIIGGTLIQYLCLHYSTLRHLMPTGKRTHDN